MKPKPYNIELHIEELVLHGFSPNDRHAIGEAVQRELTPTAMSSARQCNAN